jgi:serine/threonine protein kinase/tetratricopeptide (TPR) repeat protein
MDQDRWKTVNHIFHAALEVSPSERHAFVHSASNGDPELQAEVEILLKADQDAGSYLETPLLPGELFSSSAPPVSPGDVLCGRFQILRAVGEGGMGHVFEAYDSELAVHVALKIIRPEIASNPETLDRFRQEVRLARQITHPNVCRTFDIERETRVVDPASGTKKELVFLTMEFLQGETLHSRVKRFGPLPLEEALQIASQVADALFAAHSLGIVHRDMKPANIMLVPVETAPDSSFRAVITDFGLARLDTALPQGNHSPLSYSGRPIGTLAYMAPEQLEGTAVSAATDIYAFGLILFEMVTGTRAFPTDNFLSGIARRLSGSPPSPSAIVPDLPASWCRVIEGCLRLNPAVRFQSATDAIAVLEGRRANLPRAIKPTFLQRLALTSRSSRTRLLALSGVLCAAVALFFGGYRLYQSREDSKVNPGALVYLTQVQNQTGNRELDDLTPLLRASLGQSARINLLDQGHVGDIVQQMTKAPDAPIDMVTAREIAMRAGAVRVIFATVTGSGGNYQLKIDLQQPDSKPTRYRDHWYGTFPWKTGSQTSSTAIPPELLHAFRDTGDWIREKVGESSADIARLDIPPGDVTTKSWEALSEFNQAETFVNARQQENAVEALRNAVKIDPQFALAYARLGDVLDSIARDAEGYQAYRKALEVGLEERLTRRERDRIRGMIALDTEDEASAEAAFRDYATYYEYDYAGWFYRAYPLMMLGRTPEAIETLRKAFSVDPNRVSAPAHLARYELLENDLNEAWKWQKWMGAHGFQDDASFVAGQIELTEKHYDAAEQSFRTLLGSSDPYYQSLGQSLLARVYSERGRQSDAMSALDAGIDLDTSHGFLSLKAANLIDRAYLWCSALQLKKGMDDVESALALRPGLSSLLSSSGVLGHCEAESGGMNNPAIAHALANLRRNVQKPDESLLSQDVAFRVEGELQLALGHWKEGIREFEKADVVEPPADSRAYLARAYEMASKVDPDHVEATRYKEKAFAIYGKLSTQAALTWDRMLVMSPGAYSDDLESFLHIAMELKATNATVKTAQDQYESLRGHQFALDVQRQPYQ